MKKRKTGRTGPAEAQQQEVKEVRIEDIVVDHEAVQIRVKLDNQRVKVYRRNYQNGVTMPPVKVAVVEKTLVLVDGFHRIEALKSLGEMLVNAVVITGKTMNELRWLAGEANMTHGASLTYKERREAFNRYMAARQYRRGRGLKSLREIAADLHGHISASTVRAWMKDGWPKIAARYSGEEGRGSGEPVDIDPDDSFADIAERGLRQALTAYKGVKGSATKGKIIQRFKDTVREMEDDGGWTLFEEPF